jgi:hypothetical protein
MSRHFFALALYGVGLSAILFSLIRTYYRVWKVKKETSASVVKNHQK